MTDKKDLIADEPVARTARDLALDIWTNTHGTDPKYSDADKFLDLVACCAYALKGRRPELVPGKRVNEQPTVEVI